MKKPLTLVARDPSIELVLMDINLPGTSGINAISMIRAEFPLIPVVGLSSSDDKQTILDAIDAGAMGFIPKSSSSAVLFAALQLVLSKGIYLPPEAFLRDRSIAPRTLLAPAIPDRPGSSEHATPGDLGLTQRQSEVLFLILQGKSAKAICRGFIFVQQHRENSHLGGPSRIECHDPHAGRHCGGPHGSSFRRMCSLALIPMRPPDAPHSPFAA